MSTEATATGRIPPKALQDYTMIHPATVPAFSTFAHLPGPPMLFFGFVRFLG